MGTGEVKDATGTGEILEQELLGLGMEDTMEEDEKREGPSTEPHKAVEDAEESGGRRKIILSDLEKLHLSSLSLMGDTEAEPPPKPARLRLQAPLEAMLGVQAEVAWEEKEEEEEEAAMEEGGWLLSWAEGPSWAPLCLNCSVLWGNADLEESDSEEEEEEEGSDLGIMGELVCSGSSKPTGPTLSHIKASGMALPHPSHIPAQNLIVGSTEKYPTWKRTLDRRAREAQMKRFCKAQVGSPTIVARFPSPSLPHALGCTGQPLLLPTPQAIQRRLEEIEVTFRELEQQGIKLEKFLREDTGKDLLLWGFSVPKEGFTPLILPCLADSPADQKTQWMNQLLYLVQKKNSLMLEESDLMIT